MTHIHTTRTVSAGATSPTQCECAAGYTQQPPAARLADGAMSCAACPAGFYKDSVGAGGCRACPNSQTTVTTGSSNVRQCVCAAGAQQLQEAGGSGARTCQSCKPGTFKPSQGPQACTACAAGNYSRDSASSACLQCVVGTYNSEPEATSCLECPSMFQTTVDAAGAPLTGAKTHLACVCRAGFVGPRGHFIASDGSRDCKPCASGSFSVAADVAGVAVCLPCPAGTFMPRTGATACAACPNGSVPLVAAGVGEGAAGGATTCVACGAGKYSGTSFASACSACPAGKLVRPSASNISVSYEVEHTLQVAPVRLGLTPVSLSIGATTCEKCSEGKYSVSGSSFCLKCPAGSYNPELGAGNCTRCPIDQYQVRPSVINSFLVCPL